MDLSLKQRLLGAAVLIALAVIFVPMLMSGSAPRKSAELETTNLAIPQQPDHEFQQRVLPVDAAATKPTAPAAPAVPDPDKIVAVDTATATKPAASSPAPIPTPAPTPVGPSKPAATAKPEIAPAVTTVVPAEAVKPAPGQAANGHYFVNLGVYSATKNSQELVAALKKGGFPASAESSEFQGKPAERVRVGPFVDRAAAEAARLRIKQLKPAVPGSVVQATEDAKVDAPASALPANHAGGWAVQLGALKTPEDANKLRDRLKNAGFVAFVDKVDSNGSTLWRVRAGPEVDRGSADKLKAGIKEKLKLDGIVVTL
ncbi:MAG: SPOR domain-containing protein [Dokdonella sp.]